MKNPFAKSWKIMMHRNNVSLVFMQNIETEEEAYAICERYDWSVLSRYHEEWTLYVEEEN